MTLEASKFHQIVPNLKGDVMVSLKTSQGILWILCIRHYTSAYFFGSDDKKANKILGNCDEIPPSV